MTKEQTADVIEAIRNCLRLAVSKLGPGEFVFFDLFKVYRGKRKGLPPGILNGKVTKAVPDREIMKVRILKGLKDLI